MVRKSRDDAPGMGVLETANPPVAEMKRKDAQAADLADYAAGKRMGWSRRRGAFRPINLERRAHFSRNYSHPL